MVYDLKDKNALVTGGSRGIGAAIAKRLAKDGAKVVLTYSGSEDAAKAVAASINDAGGQAIAVKSDAGDPEQAAQAVRTAVDTYGTLDIYVHNAGISKCAPISEASFDDFRRIFRVNVDGVYAGTKEAVDKIRDGGRIIIISSINAHSMPVPGGAMYGGSKAAVNGLVRGWARDLGRRHILVNAIQPGPIDTDMNPANGPYAEMMRKATAVGRYGKAEEVAALTAFLASDEASYITGTTIDIDGGMTV